MSDEERLSKLEETLRKFNIVSTGSNSSQIVPRLERPGKDNSQLSIGERIAALEKIHNDFRIVGAGNVRVEGSMAEGFCINSNCPGDEPAGFPNPVPPPPNIDPVGNCCYRFENACDGDFESHCLEVGGVFLGETTCEEGCLAGCCDAETLSCFPGPTGYWSYVYCEELGFTPLEIGVQCGDGSACFFGCCFYEDPPFTRCGTTTEEHCVTDLGGTWDGPGSECPNIGACCIGETCSNMSEEDCGTAGGSWQGAVCLLCNENTCAP